MIRGINTINANMNILQKKQENIGNNLANANTPGFKYQEVIQATRENNTMINYTGGKNNNERRELGEWVFSNEIDELYTSMKNGSIMETEDPLDYAVPRNGYFAINLNSGERAYTRNGNFALNENNQLVTMEGHQVVGRDQNGTEAEIVVDHRGNIQNSTEIMLFDFPEGTNLERMGDTMFLDPDGQAQEITDKPLKGFLEMSNAIIADEMVRLIQVAREFEANQKALHASDETLTKTVNDVGRV